MKSITIPIDLARTILSAASNYDNQGPFGEGWQSDELEKAVEELEAIIKFETEDGYEREAFDADARRDIAYAMSKFVDNGDGTLSWPKTSTGEVLQEAESKLSESELISIRRAKKQANYLIEKLSDINFSSAHEAVQFAKDGIEHIIIDLDRFEDDSQ